MNCYIRPANFFTHRLGALTPGRTKHETHGSRHSTSNCPQSFPVQMATVGFERVPTRAQDVDYESFNFYFLKFRSVKGFWARVVRSIASVL